MIDLIDLKIYRTSYYGYLWFIKFINQLFTLPMTTKEGLCRLAAPFSWPFVAIQCRIMQIINQPRTIVIKLTSVDGRHMVLSAYVTYVFVSKKMPWNKNIQYDMMITSHGTQFPGVDFAPDPTQLGDSKLGGVLHPHDTGGRCCDGRCWRGHQALL